MSAVLIVASPSSYLVAGLALILGAGWAAAALLACASGLTLGLALMAVAASAGPGTMRPIRAGH